MIDTFIKWRKICHMTYDDMKGNALDAFVFVQHCLNSFFMWVLPNLTI